MGEWLMYGILARYRVVLVERPGGLFFDGRRSCIEDSFVGRSGLYRGRSLVVSMLPPYVHFMSRGGQTWLLIKMAEVTLIDFLYLNRPALSTFTEGGPHFQIKIQEWGQS